MSSAAGSVGGPVLLNVIVSRAQRRVAPAAAPSVMPGVEGRYRKQQRATQAAISAADAADSTLVTYNDQATIKLMGDSSLALVEAGATPSSTSGAAKAAARVDELHFRAVEAVLMRECILRDLRHAIEGGPDDHEPFGQPFGQPPPTWTPSTQQQGSEGRDLLIDPDVLLGWARALQLAGLACIESITAWQAAAADVAGAAAAAKAASRAAAKAAYGGDDTDTEPAKPPPKRPAPAVKEAFMHRGENYVVKMMHDLDFLLQPPWDLTWIALGVTDFNCCTTTRVGLCPFVCGVTDHQVNERERGSLGEAWGRSGRRTGGRGGGQRSRVALRSREGSRGASGGGGEDGGWNHGAPSWGIGSPSRAARTRPSTSGIHV